jgi:hypothetical protein
MPSTLARHCTLDLRNLRTGAGLPATGLEGLGCYFQLIAFGRDSGALPQVCELQRPEPSAPRGRYKSRQKSGSVKELEDSR